MNLLICNICEVEFEAKRSDTKYCSEKCRTRKETMDRTKKKQESLKNEIIPVSCLVCKELFTPSKYKKDQIYCGSKCLNKAMGIRQSSKEGYSEQKSLYDREYRKNNPDKKREVNRRYKDRIRFGGNKENVLERDGHKCVKCGEDEQKRLIIHHKDHSGSSDNPNNDMNNLETLCRKCHMTYHSHEDPNHVMYHKKQARLSRE